ncbi:MULTISPECIES: hypothetical protein [Streptomyces]|uniref:hypothetical protein n=1 Tax=Streptomyces TaxID=1883 RepID=UPI0022496548|nr:hypothetical protein [Streptomyces sp. JHD 1]MCX2970995.1 hypothetical protein [Streptomyces sp. JHD 1]
MSMYAREFFAALGLPFADCAVVGTTYYASPAPGGPLRLRIDFCRTVRADEYDGLRVATYQDRGELDAAVLRFEDHKTFDHRDAAQGRTPLHAGYGTFQEFGDRPDWVPWEGAHTNGLRDAIDQYVSVWFPGYWPRSTPVRTAARTARQVPSPPGPRGGRSR